LGGEKLAFLVMKASKILYLTVYCALLYKLSPNIEFQVPALTPVERYAHSPTL
jgi:hypothetical protein